MRYEFGHGLSYTTFSMSRSLSLQTYSSSRPPALPPAQPIAPGGNPALWDALFCITASITNTGSLPGATVPQLYLGLPQPANQDSTPVKVLRGFEKVFLRAGESAEVKFDLTRRDVSYWDVVTQAWTIAEGEVSVMVGFSSRDIQATTSFTPLG